MGAFQSKVRYSFIVRHGERADSAGKPVSNYCDPPLTPTGISQAQVTGKFFKKQLNDIEKRLGKKFDSVLIESSPFVRCI